MTTLVKKRESNETRAKPAHECPECGGHLATDPKHGEVVCEDCGLVASEREIDFGPEWRAFDSSERQGRARTGSPLTESLHDYGLSTVMGRETRDAQGRHLTPDKRLLMARMRRLHQRSTYRSGAARNLAAAITEIRRMASVMDMGQYVTEQAIRIYRRAASGDLIRGRSIDGIAAASLYASARINGLPSDPDVFARASHVDRRTLLRLHRILVHELDLKARPATPYDHVNRFASALTLPHEVAERARALLERADRTLVTSGRSPTGLAAAAIYIVAQRSPTPRTQRQVSEATGVTEVTIRHRARDLLPFVEGAATAANAP